VLIDIAHAIEIVTQHNEHIGFFSRAETWIAITWIIVVVAVARPIFHFITNELDLRKEKIRMQLNEAEQLRKEAEEMLIKYQKNQHVLIKEAEEIIKQSKERADFLAEKKLNDLENILKNREQQAIDRINQAKATALNEVRDKIVDIVINTTRKLVAENLSPTQTSTLIDQVIKNLPKQIH
jgi:F-type H+-transporting ATPase subunit b